MIGKISPFRRMIRCARLGDTSGHSPRMDSSHARRAARFARARYGWDAIARAMTQLYASVH